MFSIRKCVVHLVFCTNSRQPNKVVKGFALIFKKYDKVFLICILRFFCKLCSDEDVGAAETGYF